MVAFSQDYPVLDTDPFSVEFPTSPDSFHGRLRDVGPVFQLSTYGIWGMARYEQVSAALNDWQTYCSRHGAGLANFNRENPWRPPSLILEADPPLHTRRRGVLTRVLSRSALERLRDGFEQEAQRLIEGLILSGDFDAVKQLAEAFPFSVFPDAFLAAANRDPRKWQDPDKFDIRRKTLGHVGFGFGIHACVGQMVARLEAAGLFKVLAQKVVAIQLTGEPTWRLNNTIRGLDTLPLALRVSR